MGRSFPWYDSPWLASYVRATEHLRAAHPARLGDFVAAFDVLRTDPAFTVRKFADMIGEADRAALKQLAIHEAATPRDKHEMLNFGRLIVHDAPLCTRIQAGLTERISDIVNEPVEPCYNFLSLYNNLGVCAVHMDAPSAKWTFDYCIEQSGPWPIHLSQVRPWPEEGYGQNGGGGGDGKDEGDWDAAIRADPANRFAPFTLEEDEAIVFAGSSQWHYRDRIERRMARNYCHLVFFHYVPAGTRALTDPRCWAEHFGIASLASVVASPRLVNPRVIG